MEPRKVEVLEKVKKKGYPVGRLGSNVKDGASLTLPEFFRKFGKTGLPHVGAGSIKP